MSLPKQLQDKWDEAEATSEPVDVGPIVVCDVCNDDYTNSDESGGFIFGSYAYCPECAVENLPAIEAYGEAKYIKARCPEGQSFADFIRAYRGPEGGKIQIRKV